MFSIEPVGDIQRFRDSEKLISYAGMAPSVKQSSDVIHHGRITYQGSRNLRWIIVEALCYAHRGSWLIGTRWLHRSMSWKQS
ncbi:MAG: IS110 family transposase [Candidatus Thermoplasmatota archaeon]|nr:IS110 family transposase [Candidatus Thermoplasmatota archaeon]